MNSVIILGCMVAEDLCCIVDITHVFSFYIHDVSHQKAPSQKTGSLSLKTHTHTQRKWPNSVIFKKKLQKPLTPSS